MTYKVIAIAILSVFLAGISYGAENIYTWIDKQGVLNITDQHPPDGAEIIDISPSHRKEAERIEQERFIQYENMLREQEQQRMKTQISQKRKIEAEEQKKADELYHQALSENEVKGTRRIKRWSYRKARIHYREALHASDKAEKARRQADELEKQLSTIEEGES